ncbi:DUF5694 domain-containing protein [Niveispirillum sp. KHB5.9]|uniref:DUF5694 domain-containing protein n=1 Tax=Niveispirillum sp. KHB5.9 TaxID=3400269 RepID=UPI003A8AFA8E
MRGFMGALALLSVLTLGARAVEAPVEVMVLGTYHFANPGQDKVNAQVDPVTTPAKQAQLAELAERLAKFKPTVIAVERVAKDQATMLDHRYPEFTPADLLKNPDERVQIAYRLANRLGLRQVYAVDEVAEAGEPDYFPFEPVQKWADANGKADVIGALFGPVQAWASKLEQDQKTRSVSDLLAELNAPDHPIAIKSMGEGYYRLLTLGKGRDLPGADLNARWYARNARIFAKLTQVVRPGDRVLLVYGSGHNYWLRHFASETAGFRLAEVGDYLGR